MTKLFCGIDVAKYEHVASIYDPITGEMILDSLSFTNNDKGFKTLLANIDRLCADKEIIIGFESTGHYHQALFNFLTDHHFKCYLINAYMTNRFRSISLRDVKNDNIDSYAIARFLSFEYKDLISSDYEDNELKELANQRHFLIKESSKMKIKLKAYLDRTFPELEGIVDIHRLAIRAILKEYPTAKEIAKVRVDHLKNIAFKASKGRFDIKKIEIIKEAAKSSIGIFSSAIGINIQNCIESLELQERQIDRIEKAIKAHPIVIDSPLHQLKGINDIEIGYIMSAIISIDRFASYEKLIAYAGLDPKIRQSGTWQAKVTRMSKRGNKLLRYALIWTAYNISRKEGTIKDYYDLKREQGKSHYNALGHCASKLCRYIYWILKNPDKKFIY